MLSLITSWHLIQISPSMICMHTRTHSITDNLSQHKNVGIWSTWVQRVFCFMQIRVTQLLFYADPHNSNSYVRKVLPVDLLYSPTVLLQFHHFLSIANSQITSVYTHTLQYSEYQRNRTLFFCYFLWISFSYKCA